MEDMEHMDVEIPETHEHNQGENDDSSPMIPTHGKNGENGEDEHMSNTNVDPLYMRVFFVSLK